MKCPTLKEVKEADHVKICEWYRFLTSEQPGRAEEGVSKLLYKRFYQGGGFTPAISKAVGRDPR